MSALTRQQLGLLVENLRRWEGEAPWMYQDNASPEDGGPYVTAGMGMRLATVADALALPFFNVIANRPATPAEVSAEWKRVHAMPGAMPASRYQNHDMPIELLPADVVTLAEVALLTRYLPAIIKLVPGLCELPWPAVEGLVDIAWNCGGLAKWPSLVRACNAGDWRRAAVESHRKPPTRDARNNWTRDLFEGLAAPVAA